jgi:hypothetical protein
MDRSIASRDPTRKPVIGVGVGIGIGIERKPHCYFPSERGGPPPQQRYPGAWPQWQIQWRGYGHPRCEAGASRSGQRLRLGTRRHPSRQAGVLTSFPNLAISWRQLEASTTTGWWRRDLSSSRETCNVKSTGQILTYIRMNLALGISAPPAATRQDSTSFSGIDSDLRFGCDSAAQRNMAASPPTQRTESNQSRTRRNAGNTHPV